MDGVSTYLADGSTTTVLPAGTRAIVAMNGTSMLNNAVEQLDLLWPNETIAQRLEWTGANPDLACSRSSTPHGTWRRIPRPSRPSPTNSKPDPVGR